MTTGFVERQKGKTVIGTQYQAPGGAFYSSSADNLTATPSGNQGNAALLAQQQNRITTVASAGDAFRLPQAGTLFYICPKSQIVLSSEPDHLLGRLDRSTRIFEWGHCTHWCRRTPQPRLLLLVYLQRSLVLPSRFSIAGKEYAGSGLNSPTLT
jgi:hypothetical protein